MGERRQSGRSHGRRHVAPAGRVVGVDMTPRMLARARTNAALVGAANAEFHEGMAEALADGSADIVTSNGVIDPGPDKDTVFKELYRVLKPGGPPAAGGHRRRAPRAARGQGGHRPLDPLNCRRSPGGRDARSSPARRRAAIGGDQLT